MRRGAHNVARYAVSGPCVAFDERRWREVSREEWVSRRGILGIAFITGTSSGLGRALAAQLLEQEWSVLGCSRRQSGLPGLRERQIDLSDLAAIPVALGQWLGPLERLDLVVLNAGVLGDIRDLSDTPVDELQRVMTTNVWANKVVMDWLCNWGRPIDQVVMISSGAAVLGNRGWGAYALSKASLNMLAKLYAHELDDTHIAALAPGILDTAMMDYLCEQADAEAFPALQRLRAARGTAAMLDPPQAAQRVLSILASLRERPSGSFVDIREILDPAEYARLYGGT